MFLKPYYQLAGWLRARPKWHIWLAAALFFLIFFSLYFSVSTLSAGDDHFFHFRFAREMLDKGFFASFQDFKSIYFSKMAQGNDYFMYYNFLFFLVAIPFSLITPIYLGIKLYAVVAAVAAFTLLYWCLRKFEVRNPLIWTIAMLAITSVDSIWRFFLSRPYALAPSLLLLLLFFLYRRKHLWAFVLSFAYLFWHSSTFFMPFGVALVYFFVARLYGVRWDWKALGSAFGGTALAVFATYAVSKGFHVFIWDTLVNIYWETIIGKKVNIREGGELYPKDFFDFIKVNSIIFGAFVLSLASDIAAYIGYRKGRIGEEDYFANTEKERRALQTSVLVLTAVFFLGTVTASGRFGDYFTFFAALYIALSFDYIRRGLKILGHDYIKKSLAVGFAILLIYLFAGNMLFLQRKIALGQNPYEFYQIGTALAKVSQPGDIVYLANWSWFPQMYYWSPKNFYSEGLEPRFTYVYDPQLFWKAFHMADGYICGQEECPELATRAQLAINRQEIGEKLAREQGDQVAASLAHDFGARFVVSSGRESFFNYILSHNSHFKLERYDPAFRLFLYRVLQDKS